MTCRELATTAYQAPPSFASRFVGRAMGAWRAYLDQRAQRATVRILESLDARTLKDIGLDRTEIQSAVYAGCDRRRR